jgi:ApaG protein
MVSQNTKGITVSVTTAYLNDFSVPAQNKYVHTYKIRIANESDYTIQLKRRHWLIFDSIGTINEVEGEGVVGEQPILEPGDVHEYVSGCHLKSSIGKMVGMYSMERLSDGKMFDVHIPEFTLIMPAVLN